MPLYTRSFVGFRPSPRFDALPWTDVRIEEGSDREGPFAVLETQPLAPVDADPADPQRRNITTSLATLEEGWYRLVFLDAALTEDPVAPVHYPLEEGYPTTAELLAESSCEELLALQEDQQEAHRQAAIAAVESWTGQQFLYFEGEAVEVESGGGHELYLPKRLIEVTSVTPYGGTPLDSAAIAVDPEGDRLVFRKGVVGVGYYEQALYDVSGGDYPSAFPMGTLVITGNWGWTTAPEAVATALRWDMEEQALADANALSPTVHAVRRLGLSSIGQGSLRASLVTPPMLSPRCERLLTDYVWMGTGGKLV